MIERCLVGVILHWETSASSYFYSSSFRSTSSSLTPRGMPSPTSTSAFFPSNFNASTIPPSSTGNLSVPANKMQNISVTAGDLKSSVRAERQAERQAALLSQKPNLAATIRHNSAAKDKESIQQKGLKISPRSTVKKSSAVNSGVSTPQEELFQAVDSIFGGTTIIQQPVTVSSVADLVQPSNASSPHTAVMPTSFANHSSEHQLHSSRSPTSTRPPALIGEKDVMNMKNVREASFI